MNFHVDQAKFKFWPFLAFMEFLTKSYLVPCVPQYTKSIGCTATSKIIALGFASSNYLDYCTRLRLDAIIKIICSRLRLDAIILLVALQPMLLAYIIAGLLQQPANSVPVICIEPGPIAGRCCANSSPVAGRQCARDVLRQVPHLCPRCIVYTVHQTSSEKQNLLK